MSVEMPPGRTKHQSKAEFHENPPSNRAIDLQKGPNAREAPDPVPPLSLIFETKRLSKDRAAPHLSFIIALVLVTH